MLVKIIVAHRRISTPGANRTQFLAVERDESDKAQPNARCW